MAMKGCHGPTHLLSAEYGNAAAEARQKRPGQVLGPLLARVAVLLVDRALDDLEVICKNCNECIPRVTARHVESICSTKPYGSGHD